MEAIPTTESKEFSEVRKMIADLADEAPTENAMSLLKTELLQGLAAARGKNARRMEQAIQNSYGHHNALAAKHYDLLEQLEEIVQKMRALK